MQLPVLCQAEQEVGHSITVLFAPILTFEMCFTVLPPSLTLSESKTVQRVEMSSSTQARLYK